MPGRATPRLKVFPEFESIESINEVAVPEASGLEVTICYGRMKLSNNLLLAAA